MILKKATTELPKNFLFSAAAVLVCGATITYGIRMFVFAPPVAPCAERYGTPTLFGLQGNDGRLLTNDDLQARMDGRDWGLSENVEIARFGDGIGGVGFKVKLPAKGLPPHSSKGTTSGMGFTWLPQRFNGATSACLGYSLYLPEDFDFTTGGVLPGLFGLPVELKSKQDSASMASAEVLKPAAAGAAEPKVVPLEARLQWLAGGAPALAFRSDQYEFGTSMDIGHRGYRLPTGKWVRVEQEIVLNEIDSRDGAIRVWIDGDLKLNLSGEILRENENAAFKGVQADTHYSDAALAWKPATKSSSLSMTTFELWWK